jgi:MFS superfamily sulfate permease-like transporter
MVLGLSLIGTIIVALRWITVPRGSYPGFSYGPQYGLFITVIAGIVQVILAFRIFKASGETVPWENKKS